MNEIDLAHIRLECLIQATELKTNQFTSDDYKGTDVLALAKQIEAYILGTKN